MNNIADSVLWWGGRLLAGFICSLLPQYVARFKSNRRELAAGGILICVLAALVDGVGFAIPMALVYAIIIAFDKQPTDQAFLDKIKVHKPPQDPSKRQGKSTLRTSLIVICPKCKARVLPKTDGTCPCCQARISKG